MLKKIFIGLGLLCLIVVGAYGGFWFGWLTPPEPTAVCENVDRVVEADGEALLADELHGKTLPKPFMDEALARLKKSSRDHCGAFSKKKPALMAQAIWVKRLKCMRDAENAAALESCDQIKTL